MFTIGLEERIRGEIRTTRPVLLIGTFDGLLIATRIHVDARATASGTLVAGEIVIDGAFNGDAYAALLRLSDTCTVRGRVFHGALDIARDAFFEGQSRRHQDPVGLFHDGSAGRSDTTSKP